MELARTFGVDFGETGNRGFDVVQILLAQKPYHGDAV